MKSLSIYRLIIYLCCIIICYACNRKAKSGNVQICENYDTAIVIYPCVNTPWCGIPFYSVSPESFTSDMLYKDHLNELKITDTVFINKITKSIISRDVLSDAKSDGFDTWFMILLSNKHASFVDTLAICHNILWYNQEIYIDSTAAEVITEEIIRHDKNFAMIVKDYYDNGKWYPYLGKEQTNVFLGTSTD